MPDFRLGLREGQQTLCFSLPCREGEPREGTHISKVAQLVLATRQHFQQVPRGPHGKGESRLRVRD